METGTAKRQRGPKVAKGKKLGKTFESIKVDVDQQMLKILLNTSDSYREFIAKAQLQDIQIRAPLLPKKAKN